MRLSRPTDIAFQIIRRWSLFSAVVVVSIVVSVLIFEIGAAQLLTNKEDWEKAPYSPYYSTTNFSVLLDSHSHTIYSSDGDLTPEENILWHIANGYNTAIITDHGSLQGALKTREIAREKFNTSFKVIPGLEWTTDRIHLNLAGIGDSFVGYFSSENFSGVPQHPSDEQIQDIIEITHETGGIVIVNHYQRSGLDFGSARPSRDQLLAWGVDYFEIVNDKDHVYFGFDQESYVFSKANNVGTITGTDMHSPSVQVHGWTLMQPDEFTEEAIFSQLKEKRTSLIYDYLGAPYNADYNSNSWYTVMEPLMVVGKIIQDNIRWPWINWLSIGLFLGYTSGAFAIWETTRYFFLKN